MKKIKLLLFICLLGLTSACEPPYDGTAIIEIENEFLDAQGNPLANLPITYSTGSGDTYGPYDHLNDSFSYTTNAQGKIRFSTFKPYEVMYANYEGNATYLPIYTPLTNLDTNKLNTQKIYLFQNSEAVNLSVQFQTNNYAKTVKEVSFTGIGNTYGDSYNYENNFYYQVKKNQTVTISYSVYNYETKITNSFSQNITIGTDQVSSIINF